MALYAFDGTWNDSSVPESKRNTNEDTHVHRFCQLYKENNGEAAYVNGIGTRWGIVGKYFGGFAGAGVDARIKEMFASLGDNFEKGDTIIDIVGYSRGAAIARIFVHRIEREFQQLKIGGKRLESPPAVRFLGLFDTVASFGLPWTENEGEFLPDIPEFVEQTFHAMALDETRETFGIERCYGNRAKITEVWFRGGHGDIGGNATRIEEGREIANLKRSSIALDWMLSKARACGLPVGTPAAGRQRDLDAPVMAKNEAIAIGNVGTLSRRVHLGDLVHHTLEKTELTRGFDRRTLRRINVTTRIEDEEMEKRAKPLFWVPPASQGRAADNVRQESDPPSLVELSSRRYPFDVPPARTWRSWLEDQMGLLNVKLPGFDEERLSEFWSPTEADRALAWEIYVELETRITTRELADDEGNDKTALTSVYSLFETSRNRIRSHGVASSNAAALVAAFLNGRIRKFTAKWHQVSLNDNWLEGPQASPCEPFRSELKGLQLDLRKLASALSCVAGAKL